MSCFGRSLKRTRRSVYAWPYFTAVIGFKLRVFFVEAKLEVKSKSIYEQLATSLVLSFNTSSKHSLHGSLGGISIHRNTPKDTHSCGVLLVALTIPAKGQLRQHSSLVKDPGEKTKEMGVSGSGGSGFSS